jgi:hypothetical protein
MKRIDVGQAIQLLANLGVLAGIVFLAIEVQQNTEAQRLSAAQQIIGLTSTSGATWAGDAGLNDTIAIAASGGELTPGQRLQVNLYVRSIMHSAWQVYFQYEHGYVERDFFDAYERRTKVFMSQPFAYQWWQSQKLIFPESFQRYIDSVIEKSETE